LIKRRREGVVVFVGPVLDNEVIESTVAVLVRGNAVPFSPLVGQI